MNWKPPWPKPPAANPFVRPQNAADRWAQDPPAKAGGHQRGRARQPAQLQRHVDRAGHEPPSQRVPELGYLLDGQMSDVQLCPRPQELPEVFHNRLIPHMGARARLKVFVF